MSWLFLLAYWCSGLAGLIYEVCWTRLLTLYLGHTTAAASAVVAAFLGGLAVGAAGGGALAQRLSRTASLSTYLGLEIGVALAALVLPFETRATIPLLRAAYANGEPSLLFPAIRLASCLAMVFVPAAALGATFPMAIRWFAADPERAAGRAGALYAINTTGAAAGSLLAGFVLIPAIGLSGATRVGVAASTVAALCALALIVVNRQTSASIAAPAAAPPPVKATRARRPDRRSAPPAVEPPVPGWLPSTVLGISGFAALVHEIAWTRILAMVLGPTIYAFSAAVAAVVAGVAIGSATATWVVARTRARAPWLVAALVGAGLSNSWTASLAGGTVPHVVAHYMATSSTAFDQLLRQGTLLTAALIVPTAICFGAAFPFGLALIRPTGEAARPFGLVYALNTVGAVAGSLLCGFVFIPRFGLHPTFALVTAGVVSAAAVVLVAATLENTARIAGAAGTLAAVGLLVFGPPWNRALLASGAYLYAPYVPKDLDLDTELEAGTLLYDRDGAAATVSVKRLTGTLTLAVDGKVDASNRSDMLTQKLVAHLPLLLHDNPRDVAIVGLGSGVTVGAALRHPVSRVDVVEISPEVVEASRFFAKDNQHALDDPRTHLLIADGRSHLLLASRQYDVIISEPSNPWIAGVAALFTREFFEAARARLAPGGLICQWAHTYNIADADLRSIVATFRSVFPNGTLWLIGDDDVVMVASKADGDDIGARLGNIARHWNRPGVAADLASVGATEPFSIASLVAGRPDALARYAAGATILTDDRMSLEFSGPRALHTSSAEENGATLMALGGGSPAPSGPEGADPTPGEMAEHWRARGSMLLKADAYASAYRDFQVSLAANFSNGPALDGFVRSAVLSGRETDAVAWLREKTATKPATAATLVAISKLLAGASLGGDALETAQQAARLFPDAREAFEQLATVAADAGDSAELDRSVVRLQALAPGGAATLYFAAVSSFIHGRPDDAARLAEGAVAADPAYAAVYDLMGAAYTKLDRPNDARKAFELSLSFDAHDSTAYTNLGLLELAAGNREAAANYFAEALSLAPNSATAREGLARTR